VTGGAGYVGSHAVLALSGCGHEVVVYDNLSSGRREAVAGARLIVGDIADRSRLDEAFSLGFDAVLHFAGSVSVADSMVSPEQYYLNNSVNTLRLLDACARHGVQSFVFSSTAAVYGDVFGAALVREDAALAPINPYGSSKAMAERMIRDAANASELKYGILRYFNVVGADPEGRTGPQAATVIPNLMNNLCAALLSEEAEFSVYGADYPTVDGTCVRDFIHVADLAAAHVQILEDLLARRVSSVVNCGYGRGHSVLEVVRAAEQVAGRKLSLRMLGRRAGDPSCVLADVSRLKAQIQWQPRFDDLETMVRHSYQWHARALGRA
jgi:UDP-glucose 4-epimerase